MLNKLRKSACKQVSCVRSTRQQAFDILDYQFNGQGYVYWFGDYWAVYTK